MSDRADQCIERTIDDQRDPGLVTVNRDDLAYVLGTVTSLGGEKYRAALARLRAALDDR